ncbi:MAG: hypothetical protein AAF391_09285 [Bacteroidota bacterium]
MKLILIFLILLVGCYTAKSQDTIITNQGDTIECKITRVADDFIHFSVFDKSGVLLLRSRLPLSQVKSYNRTTLDSGDENPILEQKKEELGILPTIYDPPKFRLAVNTGFTYQFAGYEGLPDTYRSQVQTLWNIGSDLSYFPSDEFGFGIKFNRIFTRAEQDFVPPVSTIFGFSSLRDERIRFTYVGVSAFYRRTIYDDQYMHYYISGGSIHYRTDFEGDGVPFFQDGSTFGLSLGVVYDFIFGKSIGAGLGIELTIARLNEFNNNGTQVDADFNLSRIDLTFGLRFLK